jgi:hypothetical protein
MAKQVKERPILFSAEMIRALLAGRKSKTRRVMKPQPEKTPYGWRWRICAWDECGVAVGDVRSPLDYCPYGKPGDLLWVREGWTLYAANFDEKFARVRYSADATNKKVVPASWPVDVSLKQRPSIHMPRWASRITLELTSVRVERLQDISEEDAKAEGVEPNKMTAGDLADLQISDCAPFVKGLAKALGPGQFTHTFTYRMLWDELNEKRGFPWKSNPWVWVLAFRRI